jgi:hypothetical protein
MRPKIAMWSDYGAPRHKHWRTPSRRRSRSSIGPKVLVAVVVVVAGVIGISGIYPQIIDSEWVQGTSPRPQRVAQSEVAPTPRRTGIVAEIPLPPRRAAVTTGEAVTAPPAVRPTVAAPAPVAPAAPPPVVRTAAAPASTPASTPAPALASPPAVSEMRPSIAATEQPAAEAASALAIADVPDAQAKADPPADPAAAAPVAPVAQRPVYANRAPVVKRRVVHVEHRQRYSGAYAQWGGFGFPFFGGR